MSAPHSRRWQSRAWYYGSMVACGMVLAWTLGVLGFRL
jgi:hypothetical protein